MVAPDHRELHKVVDGPREGSRLGTTAVVHKYSEQGVAQSLVIGTDMVVIGCL